MKRIGPPTLPRLPQHERNPMTTAQLDHLRAIEAHLDKLLGIAAKRTPGEWCWSFHASTGFHRIRTEGMDGGEIEVAATDVLCSQFGQREADATYIATCSNNAEAGWRSTKGAIGWLLRVYDRCDEPTSEYAKEALEGILAEWPLETLKP